MCMSVLQFTVFLKSLHKMKVKYMYRYRNTHKSLGRGCKKKDRVWYYRIYEGMNDRKYKNNIYFVAFYLYPIQTIHFSRVQIKCNDAK